MCGLPVAVTFKIFAFCAEYTVLTMSTFLSNSINVIWTQRVTCQMKAEFLNDWY